MSEIVTVRSEMEIEFERPEDAAAFVGRDEAMRKHLHESLWETARDGGWLRSGSRTKVSSLAVSIRKGDSE